jgi:hypothetical protein
VRGEYRVPESGGLAAAFCFGESGLVTGGTGIRISWLDFHGRAFFGHEVVELEM